MQIAVKVGLLSAALASVLGSSVHSQDICSKPVLDVPLTPERLVASEGRLFAAGPAPGGGVRVAANDGTGWSLLPGVFDGSIRGIAKVPAGLVVVGGFASVDGVFAAGVARFAEGGWSPLGSGVGFPGVVEHVALHLGEIYVAGSFTQVGGVSAKNVARWDGTAWHALGTGVKGTVRALASHDGLLYVGGSFASAGGQPIQNVAAWDGVQFVPAAASTLPPVTCLVADARLYAAAGDVYRLAGGDWVREGELGVATAISALELAVVGGTPYAAGYWNTFCADYGDGPCLAAARFGGGAWIRFMEDDETPQWSALSLAGFGGALYMSGAEHSTAPAGLVRYLDEVELNHFFPNSAAWYRTETVSMSSGCLQPDFPATLQLDSAPPLPLTIVSKTSAKVTIPPSYLDLGYVDALLQQGEESDFLAGGLRYLPLLDVPAYPLQNGTIQLQVISSSNNGTAWFLWSPALSPVPLPIPGVYGSFDLEPLGLLAFGSGPLLSSAEYSLSFTPGDVPSGAVLYVQSLVVEMAPGGPYWALTPPVPIVFP